MPNTFSARARKLLSTDFEDAIEGDFFRARWVGLGLGAWVDGEWSKKDGRSWVGKMGLRDWKKREKKLKGSEWDCEPKRD